MELKLRSGFRLNARERSSNRTFMELKLLADSKELRKHIVLIVPLWNWNEDMNEWAKAMGQGSNRTFMELKLVNYKWGGTMAQVLIVPLWNWNTTR